ncbi:transketolase family protein [Amycolatopsis acidicola]|uniref:Transketolase family protein n=1 Tax=Amycolatopsis acidicola TaxID=2596893 RepID=A0A5N0V1P5_9PSEU|nr:transketolase C-terminal domain-containing protein [Amycolatopsis acidicola]KAA9159610.1 transketolase family protein [Amycolatopsis acidicola]
MTLADWYAEHGLSSRVTSRQAQLDLARLNERVFSVEGDLGLPAVPFGKEFPARYLQLGIAEADLVSVACGMAMAGKVPFVNTFAAFAVLRACEQIRLDAAYAGSNVKIAGYYTGLSGGYAGPSHSCLEDIAITRAIPDLVVVSPADAYEAYRATVAAFRHDGPVYLRLSRGDTPPVYSEHYEFTLGRAVTLAEGTGSPDVAIIATGCQIVPQALEAAGLLGEYGLRVRVLNMHTLKPLDTKAIVDAARVARLVVTYEDHNIHGGLGSAVASTLLTRHPAPLLRFAVPDVFCTDTAEYPEMLARYGLSAEHVRDGVRSALERL